MRTGMGIVRSGSCGARLGGSHSGSGSGRGAGRAIRAAGALVGGNRSGPVFAISSREAARGFTYDAVVVSRWDVLWQRPLLLDRLDLSAGAFVVPHFCTHARGVERTSVLDDID